MAVSVTHTFVSPVADAGNPNEVGPDEWNATHTLSGITAFAETILDDTTQAQAQTTLGLGTGDSPTFTGLTLSGQTFTVTTLNTTNLMVAGTASVSSLVVAAKASVSSLNVVAIASVSALTVLGTATVSGPLTVIGTTSMATAFAASLNVTATASMSIGIAGALTVLGTATVSGPLTVIGTTSVARAFANVLTVNATASLSTTFFGANITVNGAAISGVATQADMEAASSITQVVTPGREQFHPGVCKMWGIASVSGGTPTLDANYNVNSITDTGVGILTVTISTDFSSANYSANVAVIAGATSTGATHNVRGGATQAAGSVGFVNLEGDVVADPLSWQFQAWGDQ